MDDNSCNCDTCCSACTYKPGWFAPGEVAKAALFLDMTSQEFFNTYLAVDWYETSKNADAIFILAPAITKISPGGMYPANPKGQCVFYKENKCSIHPAKPSECRNYSHDDSHEDTEKYHKIIANEWKNNQQEILDLYPHPRVEEPDMVDMFDLLFDIGNFRFL